MKKHTQVIATLAVVAALLFVARLLDHALTSFLPINAAIITLVTAFSCIFVLPTLKNAIAVGTVFGLCSLLTSVIFPGAFTVYFVNPLVSVLPRIIVCVVAYFVYLGIVSLFTNKIGDVAGMCLGCVVGAIVNTLTVMTMIFVFMRVGGGDQTYAYVIGLVLTINTLFEVVVPPVLTPFLVKGIRRGLKTQPAFLGKRGAANLRKKSADKLGETAAKEKTSGEADFSGTAVGKEEDGEE